MSRTYTTQDGRPSVPARASNGVHNLPDSLLQSLSANSIEVHEVNQLLSHRPETMYFSIELT